MANALDFPARESLSRTVCGTSPSYAPYLILEGAMLVFTTFEYLNGRGNATRLAGRYGNDYKLVLIDESPVETLRSRLSRNKAKRVLATIPSRDDVVSWLRQHDGPLRALAEIRRRRRSASRRSPPRQSSHQRRPNPPPPGSSLLSRGFFEQRRAPPEDGSHDLEIVESGHPARRDALLGHRFLS